MKRDLNKERAELIKTLNYLFINPARDDQYRETFIEKLQEAISFLSRDPSEKSKKTSSKSADSAA